MSNIKIGIYGGTFAPVHIGHIRSAFAFLTACDLDRLFIIPNYIPPHKKICEGDDPQRRLAMLKLAFGPLPYYDDKIIISDFELRSAEPSYTYKTLEHFKWISDDLTLLCGTDNFLNLEKWKNFEKIFSLAKIAHVTRPGNDNISEATEMAKKRYSELYGAHIIDVPMAPIDISSTALREMIRDGFDTSRYIPYAVRDYIDKYDMYGVHNV